MGFVKWVNDNIRLIEGFGSYHLFVVMAISFFIGYCAGKMSKE